MQTRRPTRIAIAPRLRNLLERDRALLAGVEGSLVSFEPWLEDNKVVFFPEYTDHGPDHIRQVIEAASSLIADESWELLTPADAAALLLSILLHDSAMHLSEDGFIALVTSAQPRVPAFPEDVEWPELWHRFLREASRFDGRKLTALFGDPEPIRVPPLDANAMTRRDRLLIGEFLRRHHPRLAHELALYGVPAANETRLRLDVDPRFADAAGLIARSHGIALRAAVDRLPRRERTRSRGIHVPFIMGVLRIADYIQVQAERAPHEVLTVRSLRSPVSRAEWSLHHCIHDIHTENADPEAIFIECEPQSAAEFVKARRLFDSIQSELDDTWAVLGETYGRSALRDLGLSVRRIRTSIDDIDDFAARIDYVPEQIAFTTAGADLLKLLIGPLYDNDPTVGVRELLQNAVDAVRELRDAVQTGSVPSDVDVRALEGDVVISVEREEGVDVLSVADRGIGMKKDVLRDFFLRAGASFRNSQLWREMHAAPDGSSRVLRSGRFGIGALAAFLLGDRIDVTTRHATEPRGLTFSAGIDDEVIELRRVHAPVGTLIRVTLRPGGSSAALFVDSDWHCLSDPIVVRRFHGHLFPQAIVHPPENAPLDFHWRRIETPEFRDVQWTYWKRSPSLVCNGIVVRGNRRRFEFDRSQVDDILLPQLSVFDPNGALPINLQRTALAGELPFQSALVEDVVVDLVAQTAVSLPSSLDLVIRGDWDHQRVVDSELGWSDSSPWYCLTSAGLLPADAGLYSRCGSRRLVIASLLHGAIDYAPAVDLRRHDLMIVRADLEDDEDEHTINDRDLFVDYVLGDRGGDWADWPRVGVAITTTYEYAKELTRFRKGRLTKLDNEYAIVSWGERFDPTLRLEALKTSKEKRPRPLIAEAILSAEHRPPIGLLASTWGPAARPAGDPTLGRRPRTTRQRATIRPARRCSSQTARGTPRFCDALTLAQLPQFEGCGHVESVTCEKSWHYILTTSGAWRSRWGRTIPMRSSRMAWERSGRTTQRMTSRRGGLVSVGRTTSTL